MPTSPSEPARPAAAAAVTATAAAVTAADAAPVDLAVVGAGPAGLAAAVTAAGLGLRVALLDAGERAGGQFYRHPAPGLGAARPEALHHGWAAFAAREAALRAHAAAGRIGHLAEHHVWTVVPDGDGWLLHAVAGHGPEERAAAVRARAVLIATGAYERQLPFPGWTLPGVVGAGGAQAMLKSGLVLPGRRVVVAGSGPLLLAVAGSLAAAGAGVPAVVEAAAYTGYARRAGVLLRNPRKLAEGAAYGGALLRHRVRLLTRYAVTEAHGTDRVEAVTVARLDRDWRPLPGTGRRIACDALAVGHGLLPQLELATGLGCATRRSADGAVALDLDAGQRTSVPGIWSAGETGGIGGADLALAEGEIAAHAIAGRPVPGALVRRRARLRAFADAMGAAHRPGGGWTGWLRDDTPVCRCEEVPAGLVREAVRDLGARDARTAKLLTRAGMGWCQGRMCGPAVAALAGEEPAADRRPLSCPVTLGRLAELRPAGGAPAGQAPAGEAPTGQAPAGQAPTRPPAAPPPRAGR
ncbi:NAD(P)/FAD-dependent oxidoreductase [Streptomyces sp. H27-S2]|uniref:FAD/NAD(P)-dependent oxidoreductase n=1 Tax=Streptomyces antarcticus TaxID=2996458 RepID=UPI00226EF752|nr:NAD(P)/FAD-dependent oxidoreductase [Streptomyces sp. H27-S2]MCY0953645.1 NAD(P)/FAD-dependent oxidoreductase [Streptomyces sp. H27-S2]